MPNIDIEVVNDPTAGEVVERLKGRNNTAIVSAVQFGSEDRLVEALNLGDPSKLPPIKELIRQHPVIADKIVQAIRDFAVNTGFYEISGNLLNMENLFPEILQSADARRSLTLLTAVASGDSKELVGQLLALQSPKKEIINDPSCIEHLKRHIIEHHQDDFKDFTRNWDGRPSNTKPDGSARPISANILSELPVQSREK